MPIYFYNQWYDVLNNFSANAVEIDGVLYPTSEHAYQAMKYTDPEGKELIRRAPSSLLAKVVAKTYQAARRSDWNTVKLDVMESILRIKLAQHEEVREALIRSGSEEIGEDSPTDDFWGIGANGNGQNHLGKLWMKIRDEIVGI